jgi:hypothetical protein
MRGIPQQFRIGSEPETLAATAAALLALADAGAEVVGGGHRRLIAGVDFVNQIRPSFRFVLTVTHGQVKSLK